MKFTNAAMEANPAIGKFIAAGISLIGALRAIVPAIVAVSAVTNGLKDFMTAAQYLRSFGSSKLMIVFAICPNVLHTVGPLVLI